jgi:hypothetical protein
MQELITGEAINLFPKILPTIVVSPEITAITKKSGLDYFLMLLGPMLGAIISFFFYWLLDVRRERKDKNKMQKQIKINAQNRVHDAYKSLENIIRHASRNIKYQNRFDAQL